VAPLYNTKLAYRVTATVKAMGISGAAPAAATGELKIGSITSAMFDLR